MARRLDAISDLENLFEKCKNHRSKFERDWYLNVAFYQGDQWVRWNNGNIEKAQLDRRRETIVDNRILPSIDNRVSRKTKQRPTFIAVPFSSDESDRRAAELSEKVLEERWIANHLLERYYRVNKWAELCGAGFWKIYWDSSQGKKSDYLFLGDQLFTDKNGAPVKADEAPQFAEMEGMNVRAVAQGNTTVDVTTPFEFYPQPGPHTLDECEYIFEGKIRTPEYLAERYDAEVQPDTTIPEGIAEGRMLPSVRNDTGGGGVGGEADGCMTYELWHKPCSEYPGGKRAVYCKNKLLLEESLDENSPYDENPYAMFSCITVPGRFWPTTVATQLRGPQTQLNKLLSQAVENLKRVGNPTLMKARHANIQWSGIPGEELTFDSGSPDAVPSFLQPPEMPSYLMDQLNRIETSITEISGVHEVSKASVPTGITAASAINLLLEADDTRLGPEMINNETSLASAGTKLLKLMARFANDNRIIRIAGEEGQWDITDFKGAMLKDNTNVEVQAGSSLPRSKAARQAQMQEMFDRMLQYGVPVDERSMRKFFKEFEVGGLEHLVSNINNSELQVQREHMRMRQEIALEINDYDVDDFHIDAHEDFQRSLDYERMSEQGKGLVQLHVEAHRKRRVLAIEAQVKKQREEMNAANQQPQQ